MLVYLQTVEVALGRARRDCGIGSRVVREDRLWSRDLL